MAGAKIVVIYPRPVDPDEFERLYKSEHLPMVEQKVKGLTRLVATRVINSPAGKVAAYRLAELHFASMDDLTKATESDDGKQVIEHASKLSTGGTPLLLICDEESWVYW